MPKKSLTKNGCLSHSCMCSNSAPFWRRHSLTRSDSCRAMPSWKCSFQSGILHVNHHGIIICFSEFQVAAKYRLKCWTILRNFLWAFSTTEWDFYHSGKTEKHWYEILNREKEGKRKKGHKPAEVKQQIKFEWKYFG